MNKEYQTSLFMRVCAWILDRLGINVNPTVQVKWTRHDMDASRGFVEADGRSQELQLRRTVQYPVATDPLSHPVATGWIPSLLHNALVRLWNRLPWWLRRCLVYFWRLPRGIEFGYRTRFCSITVILISTAVPFLIIWQLYLCLCSRLRFQSISN